MRLLSFTDLAFPVHATCPPISSSFTLSLYQYPIKCINMRILTVKLSSLFCHVLPSRFKYYLQHPFLKNDQFSLTLNTKLTCFSKCRYLSTRLYGVATNLRLQSKFSRSWQPENLHPQTKFLTQAERMSVSETRITMSGSCSTCTDN